MGERVQFKAGRLLRRLIASARALRRRVARRKAGREAQTHADDRHFRHLLPKPRDPVLEVGSTLN